MADFTQNYNRYSYCLNNPLRYTDPSGEYALLDDLGAMLFGGIINWGFNGFKFNSAGLGYFATGALAAEVTLYTGPLGGAAVLGAGNDITRQVSQNGWNNIDLWQTANSTAMSMATSYLGGQLGSKFAPAFSKFASNISSSPVVQGAITQGLTNSATGFTLATGLSLATGESLKTSLHEGGKSALTGLGMGLINGSIEGYKYSRDNNIDPRNGEKILYRAVSEEELIDIQSNGIRPNPNGEGYQHEKLFYKSYKDAVNNTKAYDSTYGQKSIIIEIRGPGSLNIYNPAYMDGYNVIRIDTENLNYLRINR